MGAHTVRRSAAAVATARSVAGPSVGKASRDFAARNGRIEIIEGRQLKSMLLEHLDLDTLISLPTLPPNWQRNDIS
jgi:hypothetical protein